MRHHFLSKKIFIIFPWRCAHTRYLSCTFTSPPAPVTHVCLTIPRETLEAAYGIHIIAPSAEDVRCL